MLDSIILSNGNYYVENNFLYYMDDKFVYRYEIVKHKNLNYGEQVYLYSYQNETERNDFVFYDVKVRDLFGILLKINSIGLKYAKLILETFTYDDLLKIVENFDYQALMEIKGFGGITAKTIIESLQKVLFNVNYSTKEEKMILAVTRLGYPRAQVLKTIKKINPKLTDDVFMNELLFELGKGNLNVENS